MPGKSRSTHKGSPLSGAFSPIGLTQEFKARMFLFVACLWPLWVLALFGASSNPNVETVVGPPVHRLNLRSVLDRVDIMGYGPTHPRVAFVVVGEEATPLKLTVESVLRNTDLNRVFLICAVLDGQSENQKLVRELVEMDQGSVPHWHGLRPDIHAIPKANEDEPHGRKIHTMFHPERVGITAARMDAVDFVQLLEQKHLEAGLKSPEEDLILIFLQAGAQLNDRTWLQTVTNALIVPPPILSGDEDAALKLANAVSFRLEDPGKVTAFDEKLAPVMQAEAKTADINSSSGASYGTPAFNGAGIALRLDTYLHLPAQDPSLMDPWPANLELALNLWLCADGIDILQDASITTTNSWMDTLPTIPLDPLLAARFAAVWMDEAMQQRFFQAYSTQITRLDWETKVQRAKQSPTFPKGDMARRCRPFEWYVREINPHLSKILDHTGWEHDDPQEDKGGMVNKEEMAKVAAKIVQQEQAEQPNSEKEEKLQKQNEEAVTEENVKLGQVKKEDQAREEQEAPLQPPPNQEQVHKDEDHEPPKDELQDKQISPPDEIPQAEAKQESPPVEKQQGEAEQVLHKQKSQPDEMAQREVKQEQGKPEPPNELPQVHAGQEKDNKEEHHETPPSEQLRAGSAAVHVDRLKPKIPLRKENLEIVQKATPMDISFVPIDGGHKEHPHMGAKDENGNWGYIHDETAIRRNPPSFSWNEQEEQAACSLKDDDWKMMTQRVVVDMEYDRKQNEAGVKRDKIFCLVYTIESGHPRIPGILETWGPKCDGFMVGSTKTDRALATVEIPHEGPEECKFPSELEPSSTSSLTLYPSASPQTTIFGKKSDPCGATYTTTIMKNMTGSTLVGTICFS